MNPILRCPFGATLVKIRSHWFLSNQSMAGVWCGSGNGVGQVWILFGVPRSDGVELSHYGQCRAVYFDPWVRLGSHVCASVYLFVCLSVSFQVDRQRPTLATLSSCLFPGGSPATRLGDPPWPTDGPTVVASHFPQLNIWLRMPSIFRILRASDLVATSLWRIFPK